MSCFTPLFGRRIRVTRLDECGNPPSAAEPDALVVTDGFIDLTLTSETEDGVQILTRRADGSVCINARGDTTFTGFSLEINFCEVDTDLLALLTNGEVFPGYTPEQSGVEILEGTLTKRFALELWTGLAGEGCEPGAEFGGGYILLPFVASGVLADLEVTGEDAITFGVTGAFTKGGNVWGVGPYDVLDDAGTPSPLPQALDTLTHALIMPTSVAPPPAACGLQPMPA